MKVVNVNFTMISIPISFHSIHCQISYSFLLSILFHINPSIQASFHVSSFRILWLKSILEWSEFKSVVIRYKYQQITKKRYTADNLLEYTFFFTLNTLLFCPYEFDSSFCTHFHDRSKIIRLVSTFLESLNIPVEGIWRLYMGISIPWIVIWLSNNSKQKQ